MSNGRTNKAVYLKTLEKTADIPTWLYAPKTILSVGTALGALGGAAAVHSQIKPNKDPSKLNEHEARLKAVRHFRELQGKPTKDLDNEDKLHEWVKINPKKSMAVGALAGALGGYAGAAGLKEKIVAYFRDKALHAIKKKVASLDEHKTPEIESPQKKRAKFPFQGFVNFQGLEIDIENKKGSTRRGKGKDGKPWSTYMHWAYGEIRGTEGADGDKLDCYIGSNAYSPLVVVVHQQDPDTQKFDEDKVMLGWNDANSAVAAYKKQYNRPDFYQSHTEMSMGRFLEWCRDRKNHGKKVAHLLHKLGGLPRMQAVQGLKSMMGATALPKRTGMLLQSVKVG